MCTHSIDDLLPHAPLHCAATGEMVKGSLKSIKLNSGNQIEDHIVKIKLKIEWKIKLKLEWKIKLRNQMKNRIENQKIEIQMKNQSLKLKTN